MSVSDRKLSSILWKGSMKNKIVFILIVFVFGLCGVFGVCGLPSFQVNASSAQSDIWNGEYVGSDDIGESDWFFDQSTNSFHIRSAKGLSFFASQLNSMGGSAAYDGKTVFLDTDIDLAGHSWTPISVDVGNAFNGTFDAQGHFVFNLNISAGSNYAGFFGVLGANAAIKNLNLRNVKISSDSATRVGGLVGFQNSGSLVIDNCSVKGVFGQLNASANTGGFVGQADSVTISNSMADISVSDTTNGAVGGLVGLAKDVKINYSYFAGKIETTSAHIGGLVGEISNSTQSSIENSYTIGTLTANGGAQLGGLAGHVAGSLTIDHVYNGGKIKYTLKEGSYIGGLVGLAVFGQTKISNSLMLGQMIGEEAGAGKYSPLYCSETQTIQLDKVYFENTLKHQQEESEYALEDLTFLAKTKDFYVNSQYFDSIWDFDKGWKIVSGDFPVFVAGHQTFNNDSELSSGTTLLLGQGTSESPYLIETAGDLALVSKIYGVGVDGISSDEHYFTLQNDINLIGKTWIPIGTTSSFVGVFDGNGHTISGLTCSLHDQFEYHGLFAQTGDAVIKNLTIDNVDFVNEGAKAKSSLIGNVAGNTYLINCVDKTDLSTIANVENGNLYVAYGKNNLSENVVDENSLNLKNIEITKLYDVTIAGNGGNFYTENVAEKTNDENNTKKIKTNESKTGLNANYIYNGEYHVLLDEDGNAVRQEIDSTFGKNLPKLSKDVGEADILVQRGFKLQGYAYGDDIEQIAYSSETEEWTNFQPSKAVNGLSANWQEATTTIKVVYNKYEQENFDVESNTENSYIGKTLVDKDEQEISTVTKDQQKVEIMSDGSDLYAEFVVPYDSFLENWEYIFETPKYKTEQSSAKLRGENFEIEGIFENFENGEFSKQLLAKPTSFANRDLTVYTKWKGQEKNNTITFEFTADDQDIDLRQVFAEQNFSLFGYNEQNLNKPQSYASSIVEQTNRSYKISFRYDSLFSDRLDNYLQFALSFSQGYRLNLGGATGNSEQILRNLITANDIDSNFGRLKFDVYSFSNIEDFNSVKFYNLYGDVTFKFNVAKESYIDNLTISSGVYFGIGPREIFKVQKDESGSITSNVQINNRSVWSDILTIIQSEQLKEDLASQQELYLAVDLVNKKLMFSMASNQVVDEIDISELIDQNNSFSLQYRADFTSNITYTITYTDVDIKTLKLERGDKTLVSVYFDQIDQESATIEYQATNDFVFIFSAQDNSSFSTYGYDNVDGVKFPNVKVLEYSAEELESPPTKFMVDFDDVVRQAKQNGEVLKGELRAVTRYTNATFKFDFRHEAELEQVSQTASQMGANAPKIINISGGGKYSVGTNGTATVYIENSDYFRFFADRNGSETASLYSDGNMGEYPKNEHFNVRVVVSNVGTESQEFVTNFNSANDMFLNASIEKFSKGTQVDELGTFLHDVYKISLYYLSTDQLTGLRAGLYTITLVCTDVLYSIDYSTRFVEYNDLYDENLGGLSQAKLLDDELQFSSQEDSSIQTNVTVSDAQNLENSITNIKFSDEVNLSTSLGEDNKGYTFFRWLAKSEGGTKVFAAQNYSSQFGNIFQASSILTEGMTANKITLSAIYVKKQITLSLAQSVKVGEVVFTNAKQGITLSMSSEQESISSYTYSFTADEPLEKKIDITLGGANGAGFYFTGYRIVDGTGNERKTFTQDQVGIDVDVISKKMTINLDWLQDWIKTENLSTNSTYYIQPILQEKTAEIYFHSGTGNENDFGDGRDGHVFQSNNQESTNLQFQISSLADAQLKFRSIVNLNSVSFVSQNSTQQTIANIFHHRMGYQPDSQYLWAWTTKQNASLADDERIFGNAFTLTSAFFEGASQKATIHLYRVWNPISYNITFLANNGTFADGQTSLQVSVLYDNVLEKENIPTEDSQLKVSRSGYHLSSWNTVEGNIVFTAGGDFKPGTYFNEKGEYIGTTDLTLYANWSAITYNVEINFNGATQFVGKEGESAQFQLAYGSAFKDIVFAEGVTGVEALSSSNVSRPGFLFNGLYAISDGQSRRISNSTIFNQDLLSFVFPELSGQEDTIQQNIAIVLYVGWQTDQSYFALSLNNNNFENLVYNMQEQPVYLAQIFSNENVVAGNYEIVATDDELQISLPQNANVDLDITLQNLQNATVTDNNWQSFVVLNAGYYSVALTITITDKALMLNLGRILTLQLELHITVLKASLDLSDVTNFDDMYLVNNLQRLVGPFLSTIANSSLTNAGNLENAVNVIKNLDSADDQIKNANNQQVYEFAMTKYYLLATTNNSTQHAIYKTWKYADYLAFKQTASKDLLSQISRNTIFFGFFDYQRDEDFQDLTSYATSIKMTAQKDEDTNFNPVNLSVENIKIGTSFGIRISANNLVELRVYVKPNPDDFDYILDNYVLETDTYGSYFVGGTAYIMPQILTLKNYAKNKSAYYSQRYEDNRDAQFVGGQQTALINGREYYLIGNYNGAPLYFTANLKTSNIGFEDAETPYTYSDLKNYLYFTDVSFVVSKGGTYTDMTPSFKPILSDDDIFIILTTEKVATLQFSAKYLTKEENFIYLRDLMENLYKNILQITKITLTDGTIISDNENLKTGNTYYNSNEMAVFEIVENDSNNVEVFVSKEVKSATFSVKTKTISDRIALFKWSDQPLYEVDGTMEDLDSFTIEIDKLDTQSSKEVSEFEYYAIFTDLVRLEIDKNFPENWNSEYVSALKLGETVTESILPYEEGFGRAVSLKLVNEDGSEGEDYTSINSENGVFEGISKIFKYATVKMSARWEVREDIECSSRFGDTYKLAVQSVSSFNVNDLFFLSNLNDNLFEYTYSWSVTYNDMQQGEFFGETINLKDGGSALASGTYTLTITGTLRNEFLQAGTLADETKTTTTCSCSVTLEFVKNKLEVLDLPQDEQRTATYNGQDHKRDFTVHIEYTTWDNDLQSEKHMSLNMSYIASGLIYFEIDDGKNTEMIDAGTYKIRLCLLETLFDLGSFSEEQFSFNFTVLPFELDLNTQQYKSQFSFTKLFNQPDPQMERQLVLAGEQVVLVLSRDKSDEFEGEDIGTYEVYLSDIRCTNKNNFKFVYSTDTEKLVLFENDTVTQTKQSIGTFTISKTGGLQVILSGDEMQNGILSVEYDGKSYSMSITENKLSILHEGANRTLDIALYDNTLGQDISAAGNIWEILKDKTNSVVASFFTSVQHESVTDADTYYFQFDMSNSDLSKYFSSISISTDYRFVITPKIIETSKFNLNKTYDNKSTAYIDLQGNVLDDIQGQEVYILATYNSVHFGDTVVTLELNIQSYNFTLETPYVNATINKLKATLKLQAIESAFKYGEISMETLAENLPISNATLVDKDDKVLDLSWLTDYIEFYDISYSLKSIDLANSRGFLYKGTYIVGTQEESNINIIATFQDFDMTIQGVTFTVEALPIQHTVQAGIVQLTTIETPLEEYTQQLTIAQTEDVVDLIFTIKDLQTPLVAKSYDFVLKSYDNLNDSIIVTINEDNNAVIVTEVADSVVLQIQQSDLSKLTTTYDGQDYILSATDEDLQNKTFTVSHGSVGQTIHIEIVSEVSITSFTRFEIYTSENKEAKFNKAGRYALTFVVEANGYQNLILRGYEFVIAPKTILVDNLDTTVFNKTYDGNSTTTPCENFTEKVEGDNAWITAIFFDSDAGVDKDISLYLQGGDKDNYILSKNRATATISPATATISFAKDKVDDGVQYTYGEITLQDGVLNGISFVVKCGETQLSSMLYTLTATIKSQELEPSSQNYLQVSDDGYDISVQSTVSSKNYTIQQFVGKIYIIPRDVTIEFKRRGQISVEYGTQEWKNLSADSPYKYTIPAIDNPLLEEISVGLAIDQLNDKDLGVYKIASAISYNKNYNVTVKEDDVYAFEIIRQRQRIYVMFESEKTEIEVVYNGGAYNNIKIQRSGEDWLLVISNTLAENIQVALKFYLLVDGEYTPFEGQLNDLASTLNFSQVLGEVRDVGTYNIVATNTSSSTSDDVKMGKNNSMIAFTLKITEKDVYFNTAEIVQTFNNADAVYTVDAQDYVSGIAVADKLSLTLTFKDGEKIAKYVTDDYYTVEAELVGDTYKNYKLNIQTVDKNTVKGKIDRKDITFVYSSQTLTYGDVAENETLPIYYSFDFDIVGFDYDKYLAEKKKVYPDFDESQSFDFTIKIKDPKYSTSRHLEFGEYYLEFESSVSTTSDFRVSYFNINGDNTVTGDNFSQKASLTIRKKDISLVPASGKTWQDIFTKEYDGSYEAKIVDEEGTRLVNVRQSELLSNLSGRDEVSVSSASYPALQGQGLLMNFALSGYDSKNYQVSQQIYGTITPVEIEIEFLMNGATSDVAGQMLRALAYPFVDDSTYLTSNSYDSATSSTASFPSTLSGVVGKVFTHWSLQFENLAENKIQTLQALCDSFGLQTAILNEEGVPIFAITVGNNAATVALLAELLKDDTYGMDYKTIDKITFHSNWEVEKYTLSIQVADENGNPKALGRVTSDDFEGEVTDFATFEDVYEFGTSISMAAQPNERVTFYGFYLGSVHITNEGLYDCGKFTIDQSGEKITLNIDQISGDLNIVVRFSVQQVNIQLQLSEYDAELSGGNLDFERDRDGNYVCMTDYFSLQNVRFSALPTITIVGHIHTGFIVNDQTILSAEYETTLLTTYLTDDKASSITLVITPKFEPKTISVVLDFNYTGGEKRTIYVKYGSTYETAQGWQENLDDQLNEGFHFEGWFDENETEVSGSDTVLTDKETITLTAHWSELTYELRLTISHTRMTMFSGVDFEKIGDTYVATGIKFGTNMEFVLYAEDGYKFPEDWQDNFNVNLADDGKIANVSFKMPSKTLIKEVEMIALPHTITFGGENLQKVDVFDITDEKTKIEVFEQEQKFTQEAGRAVRFEVTASKGYIMSENVVLSWADGQPLQQHELEDLQHSIQLDENGILILQIFGLVRDISITFQTAAKTNTLTLVFETKEAIATVVVDGQSYTLERLPILQCQTAQTFSFEVQFAHGYKFGQVESEEFAVSYNEILNNEQFTGRYTFEISDIYGDGQIIISSALRQFTISTSVISYNEDREKEDNPQNQAYIQIGEQNLSSVTQDFGTEVTIVLQNAASFKFAGWSKDGETVISETNLAEEGLRLLHGNTWSYTVDNDTTLYAIFAEGPYTISLGMLDYVFYITNGKSNVENQFVALENGQYFESDGQTEITESFQLVYGANKEIVVNIPTGYVFYGLGFFDIENKFVFLGQPYLRPAQTRQERVVVNSLEFGTTFVERIYMVVVSQLTSIKVSSKIDFAGKYEDDKDVGSIELVGSDGTSVNSAGWIEGTRLHYLAGDFSNGNVKDVRNFSIVAYTGDTVYLKVNNPRAGYRIGSLLVNNEEFFVLSGPTQGVDSVIYQISGIVGGMSGLEITVLYVPNLNTINLKFVQEGQDSNVAVGGGMFQSTTQDGTKMWITGNESTQLIVTAYTDVSFTVQAYIRAGFYVNKEDVENNLVVLSPSNIVRLSSVQYTPLSVELSGFTGRISFVVEGFAGINDINILLKSSKYTVMFMDNETVLATVRNVAFNTSLQESLSQQNSQNITAGNLVYVNGYLDLVRTLEKHHFEGYFTFQNGAGVRYVDSTGKAVSTWQESGYAFNSLKNKFELTSNAFVDQDGNMVVKLYLYMSFLKTRLTFNFQPSGINLTAQNMVTGIDPTNSWFYEASPNYIEVSFNTDIYITAPETNGYKFFKFIIAQKTFDGTWLTAVTSYQSRVPWSTNNVDQIVEVNIDVVYFAKVDVDVVGGDGTYTISQDNDSDSQADAMISQGYVSTEKPFTITAKPEEGYIFNQWRYLGQVSSNPTISLTIYSNVTLTMNLSGVAATLDFSKYDLAKGHIESITIHSKSGRERTETLGSGNVGNFNRYPNKLFVSVNVGDQITFKVATNTNVGVSWNLDNVTFARFSGNYQYFVFEVGSALANKTTAVIPAFTNTHRAIYINSQFDQDLTSAIDMNNVDFAGQILCNGKQVEYLLAKREDAVEIDLLANARYEISQITLHSQQDQSVDVSSLLIDGKLTLSEEVLKDMNLNDFGTLYLQVTFSRLMWQDLQFEDETFEGLGTKDNPYKINNENDLSLLMKLVNSGAVNENGEQYTNLCYVLTKNLNINERFWTPIGTYEFAFNGTFDFNNHNVKDITNAIKYETVSYNGLFGVLGSSATILYGSGINWWWFLIIALVVVLLILLVVLILANKKRKKENEKLAKRG